MRRNGASGTHESHMNKLVSPNGVIDQPRSPYRARNVARQAACSHRQVVDQPGSPDACRHKQAGGPSAMLSTFAKVSALRASR